jgi:hypothetical protein
MDDGSGIEPILRKTHLPPIATVTIRNSGATSPASAVPAEQCADLKLSYQEIREYIDKAAEVAEHDYFHMLDWSPCYASGEVTFKNGVAGIWAIQQYRAGSLKLNDAGPYICIARNAKLEPFRLRIEIAGSCIDWRKR